MQNIVTGDRVLRIAILYLTPVLVWHAIFHFLPTPRDGEWVRMHKWQTQEVEIGNQIILCRMCSG